ncbi:MAG: hypothetical protein P1U40_03795 [Coxiellaceae bacterium]|nr:hypothetical protein [Coxiellaceae bacterium]
MSIIWCGFFKALASSMFYIMKKGGGYIVGLLYYMSFILDESSLLYPKMTAV